MYGYRRNKHMNPQLITQIYLYGRMEVITEHCSTY